LCHKQDHDHSSEMNNLPSNVKIEEQKLQLPIDKSVFENEDNCQVHSSLFPSTIRGLIVGKSGCGKTNLMITLLHHPNGLRYENVYLISKSLFQSKYEKLREAFKLVPEIGFHCFSSCSDVCNPEDCKENSIVIFDDISATNEGNEKLRKFFSMSRHKGISCFLLCQSYARIHKSLIRDNANFIILFNQDMLNMRHVFDDYLSSDFPFLVFQNLCKFAWSNPFGFLIIDTEKSVYKGKLRTSFHHFITFV
jgi:hypothetical protein